MQNGGYPAGGVFAAVDVQYLASSGARAPAVVTADATSLPDAVEPGFHGV